MIGRSLLIAGGAVLLIQTEAHACPSCNATGLAVLPGGGLFAEVAGPSILVLAAFLKRPFVTRAGIERGALWRSLQSTLLSSFASTFAGAFLIGAAWSLGPIALVGILLLPLLHALIEWAWLNRPGMGASRPVSFGWLTVGNILSAVIIATLPGWMSLFRYDVGAHLWWARSIAPTVGLATTVVAVPLLVSAFVLAPRDRNAPGLYKAGRAFEVILKEPATAVPIEDATPATPQPAPPAT
jgi:hypothetical protein